MKHFIGTSQKAMAEVGILQLDLNHMGLYDFCKAVINWRDSKSFESGGIEYKWVSYQMIMNNMPCLNAQKKTVYRMVERLCDFGMLRRCPDNSKAGMVFLALGDVAIKYEEYLLLGSHGNDLASTLTSDKIVLHPGQNCPPPRTELSDNKKVDIISKDYSSDPLTPLQGETDGQKNSSKKRERSPKTRTAEDSLSFYKTQIEKLHESPPPHDQVAAARRKSYEGMVEWLRDGDPLQAPGGTATTLLRMGDPLSFDQWESFMIDYGMNVRQIKHYLLRMHNWTERHKNKSIYNTICKWWDDDGKAGRRPPANPPHNGQNNMPQVNVEVPRPQKKEYSA